MPTLDMNSLSPTRRAMASKAAAGGIVSTVPVGYRIVGRRSAAHAEIDGEASSFVIQAFEQAADPANSLRDGTAPRSTPGSGRSGSQGHTGRRQRPRR